MKNYYGLEKLDNAISTLVGEGTQKNRLLNAMTYHLIHINPEKDLPHALTSEFRDFKKKMTCIPAVADEGTLEATISQLTEEEVNAAIQKILYFHYKTALFLEDAA